MNFPIRQSLVALCGTTLLAAGAYTFAADKSTTVSSDPTSSDHHASWGRGDHMRGHAPMMLGATPSPFLHAVHRLNLTADQRQQIDALLKSEHQKMAANFEQRRATFDALANPGDQNYAAAVAAAKSDAASAIQHRSDIETQIYAMLSTEQKAALPTVLSEMRAHQKEWGGSPRGPHNRATTGK